VQAAVDSGDLKTAQIALDAFTPDLERLLDGAGLASLARLREQVASQRRTGLSQDLRKALAAGNVRGLRDVLNALSREEIAAISRDQDVAAALDEARRIVNLQTQMVKAQKDGNNQEALELATTLLGLVKRSSQATETREKAAAAIEAEADGLANRGNFDLAFARLEVIRRLWPERPGLATRTSHIRGEQAALQKLEATLAGIQKSEEEQKPEKGLDALAALTVPPSLQARVAQIRERLQSQLAQLDSSPPKVEIKRGAKLEYEKGKPGQIPLQAWDDHGVKSVKVFARAEGSTNYTEVSVNRGAGSNEYVAEVPLSLHGNKTVQFYVVASDYSGHTTPLGSADKPLILKKKWRLFG